MRILVEDDGDGFDLNEPSSGRGMVGMRERVERLGGELSVASHPGEGCRVEARVPLVEAAD